jgi:glycosyltransferase involved in cell wall biosynthesis
VRCYFELRRLIRAIKPDVVHTHSSKAGVVGRAAAWDEGGKRGEWAVVHTIHGPPFHAYEPAWKNALYKAAERFAARRCHMIAAVADTMTAQFRAAGIGRDEQFVTVRSGMEVDSFVRARPGESRAEVRRELGLDEDAVVIGTVARLAELKGHDDIIDALGDDLRARENMRLLWVGDGWWTQRLTERLLRMDLRSKVVITGMVPPERVPAMIRAMDVVVHPSYREGLPRVVPQGLLCGVPVVAYDVDGTGEVCIDGKTGRLVRAGDLTGLREAVRWMVDDPARARATAEAGRAMCREMFSAEGMVEALEGLYARVLKSVRND